MNLPSVIINKLSVLSLILCLSQSSTFAQKIHDYDLINQEGYYIMHAGHRFFLPYNPFKVDGENVKNDTIIGIMINTIRDEQIENIFNCLQKVSLKLSEDKHYANNELYAAKVVINTNYMKSEMIPPVEKFDDYNYWVLRIEGGFVYIIYHHAHHVIDIKCIE
jgi:hypothetical protein